MVRLNLNFNLNLLPPKQTHPGPSGHRYYLSRGDYRKVPGKHARNAIISNVSAKLKIFKICGIISLPVTNPKLLQIFPVSNPKLLQTLEDLDQ